MCSSRTSRWLGHVSTHRSRSLWDSSPSDTPRTGPSAGAWSVPVLLCPPPVSYVPGLLLTPHVHGLISGSSVGSAAPADLRPRGSAAAPRPGGRVPGGRSSAAPANGHDHDTAEILNINTSIYINSNIKMDILTYI